MARIKLAYIGGGSTRAAGTMASFIDGGERFNGSEIVLIDTNSEHLPVIQRLAEGMARAAGLDLSFRTTTDRREGMADADAVLTSFRPGGFEARALDERIPLKHGIIGQETQGAGGFFMAMRTIAVMKEIVRDLADVAPSAVVFNYTNPVNLVAQAINDFTDIPIVSLCEGPIIFPRMIVEAVGLDPDKVSARMAGINHLCWSTEHSYDGGELWPILQEAYDRTVGRGGGNPEQLALVHLALVMESIPSQYFRYYYQRDEQLRHLGAIPRTRAEVILDSVPAIWGHYQEQAVAPAPRLDPARSRGGTHELELAIDAMDAYFNDTGAILPINLPNAGGVLPGFDESTVVEITCRVDAKGFTPLPQTPIPRHLLGMVQALAQHQVLAAHAAWEGAPRDAIRALAAHPLIPTLAAAENLWVEMSAAHRHYLPERMLAPM